MALRDFQVSIRTGLSVGVVTAVVLTATIVHVPWSLTSRANVLELNARLNAQAIQSISGRVDGLLNNAVAVRNAITANLQDEVVDVDVAEKRHALFLSFLLNQPGITSIELAWPDNHASIVRRGTDGTVRIEETIPGEPTGSRHMDVYRPNGEGQLVLETQRAGPSDYRPTEQFWYLTAFDSEQPVWSNIYALPIVNRLGVTTTKAIENGSGLIGVLGVTISLDQISSFLDSIEISPGSSVFLTNTYNELVAVQKQMAEPIMAAEPAKIRKLGDAPLPVVRVVTAALQASNIELGFVDRTLQLTFRSPADGDTYFVTLAPLSQMGLIASVVIPETDIFGRINRNIRLLLLALGGFIVAIAIAATVLARRTIATPLARVTANLRQLEDFRLDNLTTTTSQLTELQQVSAATTRMAASLASFQKYIPTELVRSLFAQGIEAELGGEHRDLTILFMDVAGFTSISETLGEKVIDFLGDYLSEMSARISVHEGTIDKYIGDAIMAFWGAPVPNAQHALLACRAALACQARLAEMRAANRDGALPKVHARIGLNTGRVLVGNVGSRDRLNYTVIGDPVNVASRLEALNKVYGTGIMIGRDTYEAVRDHVVARPLDRVAVYGKEMGVETFELLAMKDGTETGMAAWIAAYEEGRKAMRGRDWDRAIALFMDVIAQRGGVDTVSSLQIARAQGFKQTPPPTGWDGLVVMDTK